jgi:hypothetical protein
MAVDLSSTLGQFHLDKWSDRDFATHIPAVRATIAALLARIGELECECGGSGYVFGTNANSETTYPCPKHGSSIQGRAEHE